MALWGVWRIEDVGGGLVREGWLTYGYDRVRYEARTRGEAVNEAGHLTVCALRRARYEARPIPEAPAPDDGPRDSGSPGRGRPAGSRYGRTLERIRAGERLGR